MQGRLRPPPPVMAQAPGGPHRALAGARLSSGVEVALGAIGCAPPNQSRSAGFAGRRQAAFDRACDDHMALSALGPVVILDQLEHKISF